MLYSRSVSLQYWVRGFRTSAFSSNVQEKYASRLQKLAEKNGVSLDELISSAKNTTARPAPIPEASRLRARIEAKKEAGSKFPSPASTARKDNSPVKPLNDIMDLNKLIRTPHTKEQISALWTAFHASRSSGTGRGYLSASIPLSTYKSMATLAERCPNFVLPLLRESSADKIEKNENDNKSGDAYEFYFLQWAFHSPPTWPTPSLLDPPLSTRPTPSDIPISTILFTPLLEYKTRQTFSTPHLVLTNYTDLVHTHDVVLLRGEITPSPSGGGNYLLSQQDAQILAFGLQKFYLTSEQDGEGKKERSDLLHAFNHSASQFQWQDLLKHANLSNF